MKSFNDIHGGGAADLQGSSFIKSIVKGNRSLGRDSMAPPGEVKCHGAWRRDEMQDDERAILSQPVGGFRHVDEMGSEAVDGAQSS